MNSIKASTIVMPRSEPDLDGVACAVAYSEYLARTGNLSFPWFVGEPDGEAAFALSKFPQLVFATDREVNSAKRFVLVDASDLDGVPDSIPVELFAEVIDHRHYTNPSSYFPNAHLTIEPVGAAATLIVERFIQIDKYPSPSSITLLHGAIHSNTLRLRGDLTTPRDIVAADWLLGSGLVPPNWLQQQFATRRNQLLADLRAALRREKKRYTSSSLGPYEIAQLEFAGATQALHDNREIFDAFIEHSSIPVGVNLVDIDNATSYFIARSHAMQSRIARGLRCTFDEDVAQFQPARLRKQMVLAIDTAL